jgi:hypothetical protein
MHRDIPLHQTNKMYMYRMRAMIRGFLSGSGQLSLVRPNKLLGVLATLSLFLYFNPCRESEEVLSTIDNFQLNGGSPESLHDARNPTREWTF